MRIPSLKETHYHASGRGFVLLTVPHGAAIEPFLSSFPEIAADEALKAVWPTFLDYVAIERDLGAGELAHAIAAALTQDHLIPSAVVEWTYPRGIVDGGRLQGHALRSCLPTPLAHSLEKRFLDLHQSSLDRMDALYERVRGHGEAFLLDVHTMASFCPVNAQGERQTFPMTFERLADYNRQYLDAHHYAFERRIDLISDDESGERIADRHLTDSLFQALHEAGYPVAHNDPYHAAPIYLSHQHMRAVPSLSLDVPKHFIAQIETQHQLQALSIDPDKVRRLARTLAAGTATAISARKSPG